MGHSPSFIYRITRQVPVLFPLVALFHLFLTIFSLVQFVKQGVLLTDTGLLDLAWHLIYFLLWLFVCDMRKWAANGYMAFTLVNLVLQFACSRYPLWHNAGLTLFPVDVLLTAFILFYYKRFR